MDLSQFDNITPGPWEARNEGHRYCIIDEDGVFAHMIFRGKDFQRNAEQVVRDGQAIAALPDIIAYARKLEAENVRLRGALESIAKQKVVPLAGWTHEAAADAYMRILDILREEARAALNKESEDD